jgi:hypothetical protein
MDENKPPQPTPEQLLQMLDLQIQSARSQRAPKVAEKNHTISFVVIGVIVVAGMIALWVMMSVLESMRPSRPGATPAPIEAR